MEVRTHVLKRVLLFFAEAGLLIVGYASAFKLAIHFDSADNNLAPILVLFTLLITIFSFLVLRRRTRKWKIEGDAAGWIADRSWRQAHPSRAKKVRRMYRCLLCLPGICVAIVFLFLPVASRIVYSGTYLVPHYRFSVPLNWMILKSRGDFFVWAFFSYQGAARYGFTPIWFNHSLPSSATFVSSDPTSAFTWWRPQSETTHGHTTHVAKTEFKMGTIEVNCWEYRHTYNDTSAPSVGLVTPAVLWEVLCSTQPNGRDFNLHASFFGQREDVPAFYNFLQGATPTH